jgi:hypothetical protein
MINCFPRITPKTKGKALFKPYFAPVDKRTILAGPGVPTWDKANKAKDKITDVMANIILTF